MNATKAVNQRSNPSSPATSRRSFLGRAGALGTVGAVPLAGLFGVANKALGQNAAGIPASDVAILQFLAAAELLECDLWQQYCELAMNNPPRTLLLAFGRLPSWSVWCILRFFRNRISDNL